MSEIYTMTSRMLNQSKSLDKVAHNMANVNTVGFKRQDLSFKSVLDASQTQAEHGSSFATVASTNTDFTDGGLNITNSRLDLAINGDGFFGYKRGEGTVYSKDGHLSVSSTGQLINSSGESILGVDGQPIDIPLNSIVNITPQGEVKDTNGAVFGQVGMFEFNNKQQLISAGNSSFVSPTEPEKTTDYLLTPGALEQSNVNGIQESVKLTEVSRAYQSAAKLVKTFEDLENKVTRELYKVK